MLFLLKDVIKIKDIYFVKRRKGDVVVSIMLNRMDNKYHFVNITYNHICTCAFDSVQDAINDMDNLKKNGKILDYYKIG